MPLLLAVLLSYLAQNLLTPSAIDFFAVICTATVLVVARFARHRTATGEYNRHSWRLLLVVIVILVVSWQFLGSQNASGILFLSGGLIFAHYGRDRNAPQQEAPTAARFPRWLGVFLIVTVLAGSALLSLYDNEHIQPGFHGDEGESGIEARNLNLGRYQSLIGVGWYDQPLPAFAAQAWGLQLFGDTVSGLRTTSAVVGLLTLSLVYLLARNMFGARVALIGFSLMAFSHWHIAFSRLGINYNQTTLLEVLAVLTFWQGWQTGLRRWYLASGLVSGAGSYMYFGSRLVPILLLAFAGYLWWWQKRQSHTMGSASRGEPGHQRRGNRLAPQDIGLWLSASLIVIFPMAVYFLSNARELNSRAAFVFLFNDAEKMRTYTGSTELLPALAVQVTRYASLFNLGGDRSGQYGNSLPLLDYHTAPFFVLGLAFALCHVRHPRHMLLLLWLVLTLFVGGVLTIESPFTPRIAGAMPVPFLMAAVALDRLWSMLAGAEPGERSRRLIAEIAAVAFLAAAAYSNYWSYFEHYIHSIEGWAQREPATLVARYAEQFPADQTLYLLGAPDLYVRHGTIRFIAPHLRGFDLVAPEDELPVQDPLTRRASFVVLPKYLKAMERLQALYPRGVSKEYRRPWGELQFVIFEVPEEDIARQRS